jgi:hypothetical protein
VRTMSSSSAMAIRMVVFMFTGGARRSRGGGDQVLDPVSL